VQDADLKVGATEMETAEKRKHVLTEARLRANRANLEKARAAPREIRSRMTEKKLAACRANLAKARGAQQKLRESPDPDIWPSLQSSLRTAGEKLEDFRRHLRKFQRRLRPRDGMEMRLVRGLAEAAWRRLRVFRGQAQREARELAAVLRRFAGRVEANVGVGNDPSPGPRRPVRAPAAVHPLPRGEGSGSIGVAAGDHPFLAREGSEFDGGTAVPLSIEGVGRELVAGSCSGAVPSAADAGETPALQQVPGRERIKEKLRARELILAVLEALERTAGMWRRVARLNRRLACLAQLLLMFRDIIPTGLESWHIDAKARQKVFLGPDALLRNPFVSRARFEKRANRKQNEAGLPKLERPVRRARKSDSTEIGSEEEWRELFRQGLGALGPEVRELAGQIAEMAWRRVAVFRERARREGEELERVLRAVGQGSNPSPGRQSDHPLPQGEGRDLFGGSCSGAVSAPKDAGETPPLHAHVEATFRRA